MIDDSIYQIAKEKVSSEPDLGLFDRSRKKSSRSKADFFELLLAKELSKYFNLPVLDLEKEIKGLTEKIMNFKDGLARIDEQKNRVNLLLSTLIKEISQLIKINGNPKKIVWVGRSWQKNKTLSDINIEFNSGKKIGISTKSTRSGKGTQKNIGLKELKRFLGLDIDKELIKMKNNIILEVAGKSKELKEISKRGISFIKQNKYKYPIIQIVGKKYGIPLQQLAVKESVRKFNGLSLIKKQELMEFIFGIKDDELLLNVLVSGKHVEIYWNKSLDELVSGNLMAVGEGDKGYQIVSDGKKIVRIQVNFTNGIGISAFCERAFL